MEPTPNPASLQQLTVDHVLRTWPFVYQVFKNEGMGACLGCAVAPFETVAEASVICEVDPDRFAAALCRAIQDEKENAT